MILIHFKDKEIKSEVFPFEEDLGLSTLSTPPSCKHTSGVDSNVECVILVE